MNDYDLPDRDGADIGDLADLSRIDPAVASAIESIRAEFSADPPPPVGAALSEFVDLHLDASADPLHATGASGTATDLHARRERRDAPTGRLFDIARARRVFGAVVETLAGKLTIGAAVAFAAAVGVQATGVVDVPGLPGGAPDPVVEQEPADTAAPAAVGGSVVADSTTESMDLAAPGEVGDDDHGAGAGPTTIPGDDRPAMDADRTNEADAPCDADSAEDEPVDATEDELTAPDGGTESDDEGSEPCELDQTAVDDPCSSDVEGVTACDDAAADTRGDDEPSESEVGDTDPDGTESDTDADADTDTDADDDSDTDAEPPEHDTEAESESGTDVNATDVDDTDVGDTDLDETDLDETDLDEIDLDD